MTKRKHEYQAASHWDDVLQKEFAKESDRAAVILTASLFENALGQLLRVTLVPSPGSNDELLDGPMAPLASFSARINATYRVGLISKQFSRDLHLVRGIRNHFAHNIEGCSFTESGVRSRVLELAKSSGFIERNVSRRSRFGEGTRGDFLMLASWMLWSLNSNIEESKAIDEASVEWGYIDLSSYKPKKRRSKPKKASNDV